MITEHNSESAVASPWKRLPRRLACWIVFPTVATLVPLMLGASLAVAQQAAGDNPKKLPPEESFRNDYPDVFTTADGVQLAGTYLPGAKGKETVPVILLHGYKGSSDDYNQLALSLQAAGHAVLVPDLRGHGDSTERINSTAVLDAASMPPAEFVRMVTGDMEALKNFLWMKNNKEELNIEKLCIVGADIGATVALNWAQLDWARPPIGYVKQGQDIKALVLISPVWSRHGLSLNTAMRAQPLTVRLVDPQLKRVLKDGRSIQTGTPVALDFRSQVAVMIVVGKLDRRVAADSKRLRSMLQRYHPEPPPNDKTKKKDLLYGAFDTKLQGTKLLAAGFGLDRHIARFIELFLVEDQPDRSMPWSKRVKDPYSEPK